jgi:predicted small integral membrane protein
MRGWTSIFAGLSTANAALAWKGIAGEHTWMAIVCMGVFAALAVVTWSVRPAPVDDNESSTSEQDQTP